MRSKMNLYSNHIFSSFFSLDSISWRKWKQNIEMRKPRAHNLFYEKDFNANISASCRMRWCLANLQKYTHKKSQFIYDNNKLFKYLMPWVMVNRIWRHSIPFDRMITSKWTRISRNVYSLLIFDLLDWLRRYKECKQNANMCNIV